MDYAAITAAELPSFELLTSETPAASTRWAPRGSARPARSAPTPATQNAVIDAVSHLGVRHIDMPATPERVWAAINEARGTL